MYICTTSPLSIHLSILLLCLVIINSAALNIGVHISSHYYIFIITIYLLHIDTNKELPDSTENYTQYFVITYKKIWKKNTHMCVCINHVAIHLKLTQHCKSTMLVLITHSCPTLCDPMDYSPPGSSVYGILQARILEWGAIPFSRGFSQPRDQTWVS